MFATNYAIPRGSMLVSNPGRRHIGLFDLHVPHESNLDDVLKFCSDRPVDHLIIGGDFVNGEWASHWNDPMFKEIGAIRQREMLFEEADAAKKVLTKIRNAVGKKCRIHYVPGNHEMWYWYAIFNHKFMALPVKSSDIQFKTDLAIVANRGLKTILDNLFDTKRLGVEVLPYKEPLKIGPIVYLHGDQFGGKNPTRSSASKWPGTNIVFGHHHVHEITTLYNSGDPRQVHQHTSVPPLCQFNPGYLMDASTRWLHGFWVADFDKRGYFDGRVVKVFDGKIIR